MSPSIVSVKFFGGLVTRVTTNNKGETIKKGLKPCPLVGLNLREHLIWKLVVSSNVLRITFLISSQLALIKLIVKTGFSLCNKHIFPREMYDDLIQKGVESISSKRMRINEIGLYLRTKIKC